MTTLGTHAEFYGWDEVPRKPARIVIENYSVRTFAESFIVRDDRLDSAQDDAIGRPGAVSIRSAEMCLTGRSRAP